MISKTYFSIVSFFLFIFSTLFIIFITLQNGIFISEIKISNLHVKQLYIKWNEKIDISLKELTITNKDSSNKSSLEYQEIGQYFKSLSYTSNWFNSIIIENITTKDINISFKYKYGENGFIVVNSKELHLNANISFNKNILLLNIKDFKDKKRDISLNGDIFFDTKNTKIYSKLMLNIANEADLILYLKSGLKRMSYSIKSELPITNIQHIIDIANLPKAVLYWAYEAIEMKNVELLSAYGYMDFDNIDDAYKNIYIKACVNDLHYTYNEKVDKIHSQQTNLEFKNGSLFIYPKQAYTYETYLGESWVEIDFTKKEELLTINLLFDGSLDKNTLHILDTYKIKLPFLQHKGKVATDLTIEIGLRTININAKGDFFTKEANFDYVGLNIDIYDAHIKLNNFDVSIKDMRAKYKDIIKSNVNVAYNASKKKGVIDFKVTDVNLNGITFHSKQKPQIASYNISPKGDFIKVSDSQWHFNNKVIKVDALSLPFNIKTLIVNIPTTLTEIAGMSKAFVSGSIDLKDMLIKLELDVLKFSYDGIEAKQSNTLLNVKYDGAITIEAKDDIFLSLSGTKYKLSNFYVTIDDTNIKIKHTDIKIGKYISTQLYAKLNKKTNKTHVSLNKFVLIDPSSHQTLYKNNKILLSVKDENGTINIHSKELDAYFKLDDKGWRLRLNSLGRVAKKSEFLKSYFLYDGDFTLFRTKNNKHIQFISNIKYPYKILLDKNMPTNKYRINGDIYKDKIQLTINNNLKAIYKDSLDINMNNSPVNIFELIRLVKNISKSTEKSDKKLNIFVNAKNSYIYLSENRKVLYDNVDFQYFNQLLNTQLKYKKGSAGLTIEKDNLNLHGENFNDEFMNKLLYLSKFTDGLLDFSVSGKLNDYAGVMYISKSTIKDYKTLNNILAFVNTVPSLVTFKLPGYNKKGLFVDKAYVHFTSNDDVYDLNDIYLTSKEMDIVGNGTIDMQRKDIDIMLNLKTDLGSDISKIPVVGYILLDKDTISTTLSIKGDIENPKIKSHIATNIIVAPINIIIRTLKLPYKLFEDAFSKKKSSK